MNITAVILTKNEEELIADCIDSVSFCDEILLIDAGSTDKTIAIAERKGARVINQPFIDFATARNVGLKEALGEWVFYIDADERVDSELKKQIQKVVHEKNERLAAYRVKRQNYYLGNHSWPQIEHMERLFRKENLHEWYGKLHESPRITGKVGEIDGFLLHYSHRNLTDMVAKTNIWSSTEAKLRFDAHHPPMTWWRFYRVMMTAFVDSYITQKGYKAGTVGLIESIYQAFSIFITYAKLWELQQKNS